MIARALLLVPAAWMATILHGQMPGTPGVVHAGSSSVPPKSPHEGWWREYMVAPRVRLPDGRRLTLFCQGKGRPVVILDIGLGGGAWGWATVQGEMARQTRVCSYDRAGYSNSDPARTPRTFYALEADLAALLSAARLRGPYVMVGQSLGGAIVGLYAQRHPGKVAGLVLVDPAVGRQVARMAAIAPDADPTASRLAAARDCARAANDGTLLPGSKAETSCVAPDRPGFEPPVFASDAYRRWQRSSNLHAKLAETEGLDFATLSWPRGARTEARVLVLTRSFSPTGHPRSRAMWALWNTMHDEVAASSVDGVNCVVPRSTHSMMSSRPDVVIDAVSTMVDAVRGHRRIGTRCRYSD
ncbi:hypothetical protein ASG37_12410 [Sphingomonas sp. Leaf407]|uniref:alpha/beta fold hydrolase n=1 Tax=unclassified Sphingomonas TaxID=196159 RepID=UPI000701FE75|nr:MULTISPECIES: alpha/beta hydrolase [unclassified Sphingomonas]KQN36418.1 hypothetical protein ASE97_11665 [Sphingomonas sp. Leaf42]KQT27038.1 hypothetical protein ASG37_12410 [Sphingomonas sp. Leaf407]